MNVSVHFRLSVHFFRHPKFHALSAHGSQYVWGLFSLWAFAAGSCPDGNLKSMTRDAVESAAEWRGKKGRLVRTLQAVGFLDGDNGSYALHNWRWWNEMLATGSESPRRRKEIDIRLHFTFTTHRKTVRLTRELGAEASVALVRLWVHVGLHQHSGVLTGWTSHDVADAAGYGGDAETFVRTLVDLKFLDRTADGFAVHDWSVWNAYRAGTQERTVKARKASAGRWHAPSGGSPENVNAPSDEREIQPPNLPSGVNDEDDVQWGEDDFRDDAEAEAYYS